MREQDPIVLPNTNLPAEAAAELRKTLAIVAREIASVDMLRRTLLLDLIRQQSGMGVDDWLQAAESLEVLMDAIGQPGRIEDAEKRGRIRSMLAEWGIKLERLASCFQMAAQLADNYVDDPCELDGSLHMLAHRERVVRRLITEIGQM